MDKLKFVSTVMVVVGVILFIGGISLTMKELMEYGVCVGIAGIIGYAIIFIVSSTSIKERESISE